MYAFVDRPVDSLCNGGRFLLWAMRGWVATATRGGCPPQALTKGFGAVHARAALPDFHAAMALIASDGRDCLALSPMPCRRIGEDEALLLGLWRDAACGTHDRLYDTLKLLVEPASVGPIAIAMTEAASHLVAAGFDLPLLSSPAKDHQESK